MRELEEIKITLQGLLSNDRNVLFVIIGHICLGFLIYYFPFTTGFYSFSIPIISVVYVIRAKNRNHEALFAMAYIVGSEVLLRVNFATITHEFAKYSIVLFALLGFYFKPNYRRSNVFYVLFLLMLVPGIMTTIYKVETEMIRKILSFNLMGPIALAVCSIYTLKQKITIEQIRDLLLVAVLPVVSLASYLILRSPIEILKPRCTESSFEMAGGYGPNQVATILGLGAFVFAYRLFFTQSRYLASLYVLLSSFLFYRGFITFSRGGVLTSVFITILFIYFHYKVGNKSNIKYVIPVLLFAYLGFMGLAIQQTDGLLINRYTNRNVAGKYKMNFKTGRIGLLLNELQSFMNNPITGTGTGSKLELVDGVVVSTNEKPQKVQPAEIRNSDLVHEADVKTNKETSIIISKEASLISINTVKKPKHVLKIKSPQVDTTPAEEDNRIASHNEITRMMSDHGLLGILAIIIIISYPIFLMYRDQKDLLLVCLLIFWFLTINHSATRIAAPSFLYAIGLMKIVKGKE